MKMRAHPRRRKRRRRSVQEHPPQEQTQPCHRQQTCCSVRGPQQAFLPSLPPCLLRCPFPLLQIHAAEPMPTPLHQGRRRVPVSGICCCSRAKPPRLLCSVLSCFHPHSGKGAGIKLPKLFPQDLPADLHQTLHIGVRHAGDRVLRRRYGFTRRRRNRGLRYLLRRRCRRFRRCFLQCRHCRLMPYRSNGVGCRRLCPLLCHSMHDERRMYRRLLGRRCRFPRQPCPSGGRCKRRQKPSYPPAQTRTPVGDDTRKFRACQHEFQIACEIIFARKRILRTGQPITRCTNGLRALSAFAVPPLLRKP